MELQELEDSMKRARLVGYEQRKEVSSSSGVYTAWLDGVDRCLYVGRSGNLQKRIRSHFSGQRGSDRFCLYVYDAYVHKKRCDSNSQWTTQETNGQTADWIRSRVKFRCVKMHKGESVCTEKTLRRSLNPILNP